MMPCHKLKLTDNILKPKRIRKKIINTHDTGACPKLRCTALTWLTSCLGAISTKLSCMPYALTNR